MFILTSLTLPLALRTAFSSTGVSWRHGPHHGAQKSIRTGWRRDSSITSFTKVWVVVSLIRSDAAAGAADPLPCSTIVTGVLVRYLSEALTLASQGLRLKAWSCRIGLSSSTAPQAFQASGPLSGGLGGKFNRIEEATWPR